MRSGFRIAVLMLLSLAARGALAFDVGDPTFRSLEGGGVSYRTEMIWGSLQRDLRLEYDRARIGTAEFGPVGTLPMIYDPDVTSERDHLLVRYHVQPTDLVAAQFDIGFDGESSGGDSVLILGGAVRGLLLQDGPFQLTAQVSAHFVPEYRVQQSGVHPTLGTAAVTGEFDSYEYGAALLGSYSWWFNEGSNRFMSYAGPRLSIHRGELNSYVDYENPFVINGSTIGNRAWIDAVEKQENPFSLVLGAVLDLGNHWSARVETRLINESSVSGGIGYTY